MSRVEAGQVDPTVEMLRRLLDAAAARLHLEVLPAPGPRIAELAGATETDSDGVVRPDWTRLRAFIDHLALHPEQTAAATLLAPAPSSPLVDNVLAALAETLCDDAEVLRPPWTGKVRPLSERWEQEGTPRMRARARETTPPPFAARGITLSRDSLWRDQSTLGV